MPDEKKVGCARPTGGPVGEKVTPDDQKKNIQPKEEMKMAMVGQKAPDFVLFLGGG